MPRVHHPICIALAATIQGWAHCFAPCLAWHHVQSPDVHISVDATTAKYQSYTNLADGRGALTGGLLCVQSGGHRSHHIIFASLVVFFHVRVACPTTYSEMDLPPSVVLIVRYRTPWMGDVSTVRESFSCACA